MFEWDIKKRVIAGFAVIVVISAGILFFYQSPSKVDEIYTSALNDYNKGNFQNSYYLFSKINFFSELKPVAIYHQAECAKQLNDDKSELKQYEFLFNNYPHHILSARARYYAAQKLVKDRPKLAKKYFEQVIKSSPHSDYAIASEYYLGVILKDKYKDEKIIPNSVKDDVQNHFRHYLKEAPAGKFAFSAVNDWLGFTNNISKDDYLLMANSCYMLGKYQKAADLLKKVDISEGWVLDVKTSYAAGNHKRAKFLTENGLQKRSQYVSEDDIISAVDIYTKLMPSKTQAVDRLLSLSTGKGKDYIVNLKCETLSQANKATCYNYLYLKYPKGRFSANALANIFFSKIRSGDYSNARKIGKDYLIKFPDANSTSMVMFWMGKLAEKAGNYEELNTYYRGVIDRYPDSYYAYRAYLRLNRYRGPLLTSHISPQPVLFPYEYPHNNIIVRLVNLKDYEMISELSDDEFIKSWILYKQGDYPHSMLVARNAMAKITEKPGRTDLRWRLVYPVIYYDDIKHFANMTGNNAPLMLSLVREESYFDPHAKSVVGAAGLMQLMPSTASEINSKFKLGVNTGMLFNPYANVKLGNYYYAFLRNNLQNYDISAVAAYNGGIGSIQRWKSSLIYNDTDEFVEQIPYPETKNYVKKVFSSYWNYIRIYTENN